MEAPLTSSDSLPQKGALYQTTCSECSEPSKYRCPKCSALSCSLTCVKAHKERNKCDGMRNKTAFVPMEEFGEQHLLSDYHFLEDINHKIDNAQRSKKTKGLLNFLPHNLYRLQLAARQRKTNLLILPVLFSKRKLSTTFFRYSDKKILWRLDWVFPQCDFTCHDERIDEEILLGKCLDRFLLPESDDTSDGKLMYYQSMGHKDVSVLLKDENTPSNVTRYILLKQNKSLRINFKGKKIIEYPTLLVVPKVHLSCYLE